MSRATRFGAAVVAFSGLLGAMYATRQKPHPASIADRLDSDLVQRFLANPFIGKGYSRSDCHILLARHKTSGIFEKTRYFGAASYRAFDDNCDGKVDAILYFNDAGKEITLTRDADYASNKRFFDEADEIMPLIEMQDVRDIEGDR